MIVACLLAVVLAAQTGAFVWYLRRRDEREALERVGLLNRIQAPEAAVAASLEEPAEPGPELSEEQRWNLAHMT